jgi:hypothetical protein
MMVQLSFGVSRAIYRIAGGEAKGEGAAWVTGFRGGATSLPKR